MQAILGKLPTFVTKQQVSTNPLLALWEGRVPEHHFNTPVSNQKGFLEAKPFQNTVLEGKHVKAAIVTCGGLCPGLNLVVQELTNALYSYGTTQVYGVLNGFKGFRNEDFLKLNPQQLETIHRDAGTVIKSSRGGWDLQSIADSVQKNGFNHVYIIGGDGTHRGALELSKEMLCRNLAVHVCALPKTIDNDIPLIASSFGFETAVEAAVEAIECAEAETRSFQNSIGLVKVMGRHSGFIALHAALCNRNVDICLIPESQFDLSGEKGVIEYALKKLQEKQRLLFVVAEGCGYSCRDEKLVSEETDASGNPLLLDICGSILSKLKESPKKPVVRFIDPSYMVRAKKPNTSDKRLCVELAQGAVHGCFGGLTGFGIGKVDSKLVYIPLGVLTITLEGSNSQKGQRTIDPETDPFWRLFLLSSKQPSFLN